MHDLQRIKKLRVQFLTFGRALLLFTVLLGCSFSLLTHFAFAQPPSSPSAKIEPTKGSQLVQHAKARKGHKKSKSHKGNTTHKSKTVKKIVIVPPNSPSLNHCNNLSPNICGTQQSSSSQFVSTGQFGSNGYSQGQSSNQTGSGLSSLGSNQAGSGLSSPGQAGSGGPLVPFPGLPSTGCDPSPHASPDPAISC